MEVQDASLGALAHDIALTALQLESHQADLPHSPCKIADTMLLKHELLRIAALQQCRRLAMTKVVLELFHHHYTRV